MPRPNTEKYSIWTSLFLGIPVIVLAKLAEVLTGNFTGKIFLSVLIGVIAGTAGSRVYALVKRKENYDKALALALLTCFCLLILFTTETIVYFSW